MQWLSLYFQTFGVIFAIVDPFGYVPIFLTMTARDSDERRRTMLKKACVTASCVLLFFTFLGSHLLRVLGISIPALQIAGGLILLAIGFEMLKVTPVQEKITQSEEKEGVEKDDISIVPLAIPMLSGPASISTVIMLTSKTPTVTGYLAVVFSIFLTLGITYVILRSAGRVLARVGLTGVKIVTRVMGFLLCAMAVQFVINGVLAVRRLF